MNWFTSIFAKRAEPDPEPPKLEPMPEWMARWQADWEKLEMAYPIGREFQYIGRTMIVTSVTRLRCYRSPFGDEWTANSPRIVAEYADKEGVIREHRFEGLKWKLLLIVLIDGPAKPEVRRG